MSQSVVGPWAKDKLERLRAYLEQYTTIMKGQKWCEGFYYIDAFAGPGVHQLRAAEPDANQSLLEIAEFGAGQTEQQQFIAGSPRVALGIKHPFSGYVFVERSEARVTILNELVSEFPTHLIRVRNQDCNDYLLNAVLSPGRDWNRIRALVFLDPFGMQVPWSTIEALGRTEAIEVFLNFPVGMAIQRLLPVDSTKLTPERRLMLDRYFGTPDWFEVVYKRIPGLFGEELEEKIDQSSIRLLKWYQERLRLAFGYVSKAALIRNTKGGHLYYLLLASPKPTGVKIADHILSAGEYV